MVGTSSGGEIITVIGGNIRLDSSFNLGGDTITLPGLASSYTAYRSGGEVIFARNDSAVTLRIPVGAAGTEIQFDGGDSRTLLFSSSAGAATLEGQVIGTSSTSPTPLTAGSVSALMIGEDFASEPSSFGDANIGSTAHVMVHERFDHPRFDSFSFA